MAPSFRSSDLSAQHESGRVRRSRYTLVVADGAADHLLYNTLTTAFVKAADSTIDFLLDDPNWSSAAADLSRFQRYLHDVGILVDTGVDESARSRQLLEQHDARQDRLELFLLPHENCNFRCTYCYESFARNKMEPWVLEAVQRMVLARLDSLRSLSTSWFGGEPLLGYDVIKQLSAFFVDACRQRGVTYQSAITTNGYLLDPEKARHLVHECRIGHFQITLDGPCEQHDRRRHLAGGGPTYGRIYGNLLALKEIDGPFGVMIRINFDHQVADAMDSFIDGLSDDFGDDPRFSIHPFPISNLGGATKDDINELPLCDVNAARVIEYRLLERSVASGFRTLIPLQIKPLGNRCYAADPRSFIIGADGTIYKCTVAFDDPRNHVGLIRPDGSLDLDHAKLAAWTEDAGAADPHCRSCQLNPSCQGAACPLHRMNTSERPCPTMRSDLPQTIRLLAREMVAQEARRCTTH